MSAPAPYVSRPLPPEVEAENVSQETTLSTATKTSLMDEVPSALPSLVRAIQLQEQAARVGFDWQRAPDALELILAKIAEEINELRCELAASALPTPASPARKNIARIQDELGDAFFALTNLARHLGLSAETTVAEANSKFSRRFKWMELYAEQKNEHLSDMSAATLESLWERAKAETDPPPLNISQ